MNKNDNSNSKIDQNILNKALKLQQDIVYNNDQSPYYSCIEYYVLAYLNQESVQSAIHSKNITWSECSTAVYDAWPEEDWYATAETLYQQLVDNYNITMLIYSGDDDSVCGTSGTMYWLKRMNWSVDEDNDWEEWQIDEETAGFYTRYLSSSKTALHFTTIRSAGHMVPSTQPQRAFELLNRFLNEWAA